MDVDSILGNVVQAGQIRGGIHIHPRQGDHQGGQPVPRQLPAAPRGFVNRIREVGDLDALLEAITPGEPHPVSVIVGSGGVGKTALALHWAHRIRERFPDGDLFINLRGYDSGQPVSAETALERLLRALGVADAAIPADLEDRSAMFRSLVAGRKLLILLDNASNASQVRPLIPGGAGPLLVVTSRNRMPSLAVRDGVGYVHADVLHEADAIQLVEAVTRTSRTGDRPDEVGELVRLCARLPLALRIAAERAVSRPGMDLTELITDLRDTSGLWEALSIEDGSDVEDVRTVFTWSYRALPEQAAWIFRVIGLHPGTDIGLPAMAAAAGVSLREARRATDVLIGAYLIEQAPGSRYQMHDLLRAYANAESQVHDTATDLRATLDRMCSWYAVSIDRAAELLCSGPRFPVSVPIVDGATPATFAAVDEARTWFEAERQNLLAIARLADTSGLHEHALALALAFSAICMTYFGFEDWDAVSQVALKASAGTGRESDQGVARRNRGMYLLRRGHYGQANVALDGARRLYQESGDLHGAAEAINAMGLTALRLRNLDVASEHFADAARMFAELDDPDWEYIARANLAISQVERDDFASAMEALPMIVEFFDRSGDRTMQVNARQTLAETYRRQGDLIAARRAIEEGLAIAEERGIKVEEGALLLEAAQIQLALGEITEALESCQVAAALQRQLGDKSRETLAITNTGDVLLRLERAEEALAFYLQAAEQFKELVEPWNEARARLGAADAGSQLGQRGVEREQLERAEVCLAAFPDARAIALVQQIGERLR